jgi:hypothetical protein
VKFWQPRTSRPPTAAVWDQGEDVDDDASWQPQPKQPVHEVRKFDDQHRDINVGVSDAQG